VRMFLRGLSWHLFSATSWACVWQKVLSTNKVKGPFLFSSFDEALNLANAADGVGGRN